MKNLFNYSNFWLIWLGCAGNPDGTSLFNIQEEWKIKTNYLYHKEAGLGKPLVKNMVDSGYLEQKKKGLVSRLDWIPAYMLERHKIQQSSGWSINEFVVSKMPLFQKFIGENRTVLFDRNILAGLYNTDINSIKKYGSCIFDDLYTFIFISNLVPFCMSNNAEIVIRMLNTAASFSPERDVLGYYNRLRAKIPEDEIPRMIENEAALVKMLAPAGADSR
jgi:hypothetical protein